MFLSESCLQKPTEMGEGWTSSDERRTGPEVDDPPWRPQMLVYKQTKWFDEKMKEHVVHNRLQETKSHFCYVTFVLFACTNSSTSKLLIFATLNH